MFHSLSTFIGPSRVGRWCRLAVLLVCLGLAGCSTWDLHGQPFPRSPFSELGREMRPADHSTAPFAWTNKGRQIEKSFGVE